MNQRALTLALALLAASATNAQGYSGAELRQELELALQARTGKASPADYARIGHVTGYIDGFADAYLHEQVRGARFARDAYTFCLPKEFTVEELQRTASAFLARHPQPHIDKAPAGAVLAKAFSEAYPCRG